MIGNSHLMVWRSGVCYDLKVSCKGRNSALDSAKHTSAPKLGVWHDRNRPRRCNNLDELGPNRPRDRDPRTTVRSRYLNRLPPRHECIRLKCIGEELSNLACRTDIEDCDVRVLARSHEEPERFTDSVSVVGAVSPDLGG